MAEPTILRGSDHFFTTIYEGNGGGQRVGKFVPFTDNGTIAKSVIYNHASEPDLARTPSSGGNRRTFTISAWVKLCTEFGQRRMLFSQAASGNEYFYIEFNASNQLEVNANDGSGGVDLDLKTNRTFEDTSKFYHVVVAVDTTQSTSSDRVKVYVDGDQITSFATETYFGQNYDTQVNHTVEAAVGNWIATGYSTDGYIAEFNLVDGTALTPSTFGLTDTSTGRWIPKSLTGITYGTNGLRLEFANSAGQTIGDDTSGNGNDLAVSNLAAADITTDSPTQNHATLSPNRIASSPTFAEGNLKITGTSTAYHKAATEKEFSSDISTGLYWEYTDSANGFEGGVIKATQGKPANDSGENNGMYLQRRGSGGGNTYWVQHDNSETFYYDTGVSASDGQTIGVAVKSGKIWFAINNTWIGSGDPAAGTNAAAELDPANYVAFLAVYGSSTTMTVNFGQKSFQYTPPTGFVAYQQDNLPETSKGIPDFVWIKNRDANDNYQMYDTTRGVQKSLTNENSVEATTTDGLQKFLKGGFAIEDDVSVNTSGESYVSWNWLANGGTTSANTDGSGATAASVIQANQTAGFSIVKGGYFTGSLAHGLSQAPEWIMIKETDPNVNTWYVWHKDLTSENYYLSLSSSSAQANYGSNLWDITSTKFLKNLSLSGTRNAIAYCWHGVRGYSKFGSYTGNGNADGPFIYTGFKPRWIFLKNRGATASWFMLDGIRNTINPVENWLVSDDPQAEVVTSGDRKIDFCSNGFKIRATTADFNGSGATIIYMAFAEHPFVGTSSINPITAR